MSNLIAGSSPVVGFMKCSRCGKDGFLKEQMSDQGEGELTCCPICLEEVLKEIEEEAALAQWREQSS